MLGPQNMNISVKDEKLQKIKDVMEFSPKYNFFQGLFDDRFVTMEIPPDLVDHKKFESLESLLEYLRNFSNK